MLPVVAGQGDQALVVGEAFGGQAEVGDLFEHHPRHLLG
jgi:hypothetical protein